MVNIKNFRNCVPVVSVFNSLEVELLCIAHESEEMAVKDCAKETGKHMKYSKKDIQIGRSGFRE